MQETLTGTITDTVFRNEENGYTVIQARAGRETTTIVGVLPELASGEKVVFTGSWIEHSQYGRQFKATGYSIEKPSTLTGIERYLGSGLIKGIGPATARLIVEEFGMKALDILSETPERLAEISGIGKKRVKQISDSFHAQYAARVAMIFLQTYGVSPAMSVKIGKTYGDRTQEIIRANPYRLVDDIEGIGFLTADRIAQSMGIATDSEFRLCSGLKYTLNEVSASAGHTYLPTEELLARAAALLLVDADLIRMQMQALTLAGELVTTMEEDTEAVSLPTLVQTEAEIARRLIDLLSASQTAMDGTVPLQITNFERTNHICFSQTQRQAVTLAVQTGLMVITGGPGTGKTTLINCILSLLSDSGEVLLAAPTGRAAKRMSEATGHEAKTIHRLLEYGGDEGVFMKNAANPLDCACVIVDEMSMVDIFLMRSLLRAIQAGTRIILVGDADQLPPVGAGNVLGDILKSGVIPSVRLTQIFRQEGQSLIVQNAHRINHGDMPFLNRRDSDFFFSRAEQAEDASRAIIDLCTARLPAYLGAEGDLRAIQVLSPTKKGICGVHSLNNLLQNALNPAGPGKNEITFGDTLFRVGDKAMHVKNNYKLAWKGPGGQEGEGVFNGDVGYITWIDNAEKTLSVLFDDERAVTYEFPQLEELELAYCLSVHKSQGSEFPAVVMPVTGGPPMLLTRNLFYTALTRARRLVVLVGRESVIAAMVNNNHIAQRYTSLCRRLHSAPGGRPC
jgi:exodeoxyribonuclease V alpha subunit